MRILGACLIALLLPGLGRGTGFSSSDKGAGAAGFLNFGAGARGPGMGEAFAAVADDATALQWNPAALTRVEKRSAVFSHSAYVDSSYFSYAAYAHNLGNAGVVSGGLLYFSAGRIAQTDAIGTETGSFTPYDVAASVGYARKIDSWSAGIAAKYIRSRIINAAQTGAVDLGVLTPELLDDRLRLAFTASNLGGKLRFEQESESLPLVMRLGSAYKIVDRWLAALDLGFPQNGRPFAAAGTEFLLPVSAPWAVAGRVGYNSRTAGDVDGVTGVSFGFGVGYEKLKMDYALAPMGSLGLTQRVSLAFNF